MRQQIKDGNGATWAYDEARALGVIRKYSFLKALKDNSEVVETKPGLHLKLMGMPPTAEVNADYSAVKEQRGAIEADIGYKVSSAQNGGWDDFQKLLTDLRRKSDDLSASTQAMFKNAQDMDNAAIEAAETGINIAKGTRDASIISIAAIGLVATGGAAITLAATTGSGLQGYATYQDTGNVKKAVIKGGLFLLPLGLKQLGSVATAAGHSKKVVATVTMAIDTSADTFEGVFVNEASLGTAVSSAVVNQGVSFGASQISAPLTRWMGRRFGSALQLMDQHGNGVSNRAWPAITSLAEKHTVNLIKTEPSTFSEAALGTSEVKHFSARAPSGINSQGSPLACMIPATSGMDEPTRYIKQNVLSRI